MKKKLKSPQVNWPSQKLRDKFKEIHDKKSKEVKREK